MSCEDELRARIHVLECELKAAQDYAYLLAKQRDEALTKLADEVEANYWLQQGAK